MNHKIILMSFLLLAAFGSPMAQQDDAATTAKQAPAQPEQEASTVASKEARMELVELDNGLKYLLLAEGAGAAIEAGQNAMVHYTGWLYDQSLAEGKGEKFDSSRDRGQPFSFPLGAGRVIKGWDLGVAGMKVGERRMLIIPAELGYGSRGASGAIPPNADLLFDVELLGIS
ncbi:MAG: FKBP-type peptidyl-prolyl cis-trans isomerase [Gammaproteobacteria bacterium]|nr:FKBP-type peptidyl-prolyl cis-trans isomerase [Gammaproteobacteria bacterium]